MKLCILINNSDSFCDKVLTYQGCFKKKIPTIFSGVWNFLFKKKITLLKSLIFELFFYIITFFFYAFFLLIYPYLSISLKEVRYQPVNKLGNCVLQLSVHVKLLAA